MWVEVIGVAVRVDVAPDLLHWEVERAAWDEETVVRRSSMSGSRAPGGRR